jgi:hypothetical protein
MSVDIKSLRIGSHILVNNKRERVRGLDEDNGLIIRFPAEYVLASEVEPIPITPELLKELSGFEYHEYGNGNLWEWRFDDLYKAYGYLEFDEDTTTLWRGRLWHMKESETEFRVEYLHELENLFYVFYEKELIPD